jgi:hypothetical protein
LKKVILYVLVLVIVTCGISSAEPEALPLIPWPQDVVMGKGGVPLKLTSRVSPVRLAQAIRDLKSRLRFSA